MQIATAIRIFAFVMLIANSCTFAIMMTLITLHGHVIVWEDFYIASTEMMFGWLSAVFATMFLVEEIKKIRKKIYKRRSVVIVTPLLLLQK